MTWTFRNRIELQPHCRLQYPDPEWVILDSGPGEEIKIVGRYVNNIPIAQVLNEGIEQASPGPREAPIKDTSRLILTGSGYPTEAQAMTEGDQWRTRLMRAFATLNIAADFGGEDRPTGFLTSHGLASISPGRRALNDPPKLWAYEEEQEEPLFVASNPVSEYWITSPHQRLKDALAGAIASGGLSQKSQVSYSLYAGSFGLAPEPRFAMLMVAFESLITCKPRSAEVRSYVESMILATKQSGLPSDEVKSIAGSLQWLLDQSIGQAGREISKTLKSREYLNGEAPERFFNRCYEVRSRLVHGNHPIPGPNELGQLAASLEHMVSNLIAQADP